MDYNNSQGVENRVVNNTVREGEPARVVSAARTYETTREDLWDVVTKAELIPKWFLPISGDLKLNGTYQLEGHAGGEVTRCMAPEVFEVTWECGDNVSWVTVMLEPEGESTRLTLEHTMMQDEASEKHWTQYGPGATGVGWELGFMGLGLHLESGKAVDRAEADAWMGTEPGKAFIRKSAKAWGESHIESGADAEVANAMAEQTAKAYTGE